MKLSEMRGGAGSVLLIGVVRLLTGLAVTRLARHRLTRLGVTRLARLTGHRLAGHWLARLAGHLRLTVDAGRCAELLLLAVGQHNGGRDAASDGDDDKNADYDPYPGRARGVFAFGAD